MSHAGQVARESGLKPATTYLIGAILVNSAGGPMSSQFVEEIEQFITVKLSTLDLIKEMPIGAVDRSEIVRRLKMALKNELEASEIAAVWMPTTPEVEVKLALARQVGDEAKHYKLIEEHLKKMGVDLAGFNPSAD